MEQPENKFLELVYEWDNELSIRHSNLISNLDYITKFRLKFQSEFRNKLILLENLGYDELDLVSYSYYNGEYDKLIERLIEFAKLDVPSKIKLTIESLNSIIENLIQLLLVYLGSVAETIRFIKEKNILGVLSDRLSIDEY